MKAMAATRKGLFELIQTPSGWQLDQVSFLGDPVSMCLYDKRDGSIYAALNLGHFGVKLHKRPVGSSDWIEIGVPTYPPQDEDRQGDIEWKLKLIWSLECGGRNEPDILWAGTSPGGLFKSLDGGNQWQLIRTECIQYLFPELHVS